MSTDQEYTIIPPVICVTVENNVDIMIAGDAARRAAALLEFRPIFQAQIAGAVISLADLVLKTKLSHEINITGIQNERQIGIQITCNVPWMYNALAKNPSKVITALNAKVAELVDKADVSLKDNVPTITFIMWLHPARKVSAKPGEYKSL